ncbi:hypothetical protein NESM_000385400 [Novymonas esmeraldas]|uniref:Uncharacterized protein n=1 Tax=Novymonas esmeraldas TaxID=1808958 RepID=A0AAW0EKR1_9TRYP
MFASFGGSSKSQDDGYDDEQHLVAAASEFKKAEATNQAMVDQLYQCLASPFQITTKPCESNRTTVLQCYQQLQSSSAAGPQQTNARGDGTGRDRVVEDAWLATPYQRCYDAAIAYSQCVEKDTLSKHLALVAAFEQRGAQQKIVHQAALRAQEQP